MSNSSETILCSHPSRESLLKDSNLAATLTSMTSEQTGLIHALSKVKKNKLGSSSDSVLHVPYAGISREHSCISYIKDDYYIEDLQSTNGTYINGQLLSGERKLNNGDLISMGSSTVLRFNLYSNLEVDYHNKITQKMMFDQLTETLNRSTYERIIAGELDEARDKQLPIGLLMLDIDDFKVVNDSYGHLAGDTILKKFAAVVARQCRREDYLSRYGGEEFSIFSVGNSFQQCIRFAERIKHAIETSEFNHKSQQIDVTVSIGIAHANAMNVDDISYLIQASDDALYESKNRGKNCVSAANI